MIKLTSPMGTTVWIRKDSIDVVMGSESPELWTKGTGSIIEVSGQPRAVKETPEDVLKLLGDTH